MDEFNLPPHQEAVERLAREAALERTIQDIDKSGLLPAKEQELQPTQPWDSPSSVERQVYETGYEYAHKLLENDGLKQKNHKLTQDNEKLTRAAEFANIDPLTGLSNRRGAEEAYDRLRDAKYLRTQSGGSGAQVLFMDLDDFKAVNSGPEKHAAGDRALRVVAGILKHTVRPRDIAVRWGGDEFIVLLPNVSDEVAGDVAEAIRQEVRENRDFPTTVSIGIGKLDFSKTLEDTVKGANAAVDAAKASGKNIVVRFEQLGEAT